MMALGPITFNQCQPSAIPVQVTIRPAAVHYFAEKDSTAYLNVWVGRQFRWQLRRCCQLWR